ELPWDYDTMHIKCFCHKMALVVNAGLNKLSLEAPPPPKIKKAFLGSIMKLILMMLMKEKMIWLNKMMMTRMAMIQLYLQFNNPTQIIHLPQIETNPTSCMN
ncbi:hypothetical protein VP01_12415g1, partial [Puccinia sorghi]